jgi:hypothetical protein
MRFPSISTQEVWLLALPGLIVLVLVLKQVVRARLVAKLLAAKSPLATEISDWSLSGRLGYYRAVKTEFIWGKRASELSTHPESAWSVPVLRVLLLAQYALYTVLAVVFYSVFMSR